MRVRHATVFSSLTVDYLYDALKIWESAGLEDHTDSLDG